MIMKTGKECDYHTIQSVIEDLMEQKESSVIEFKSAAGGFPGSFWETYSSFANTDGGTIVLGVKEKKGCFYLDNLNEELLEKYTKEFWSNVNNKDIINKNLLSNDDVMIADIEGHKIMLFYIPRASREQRPVYHTPNPYNGTYKRNYEGDFKCTETEVNRMFADANVSQSADTRILKNYTFEDIDKTSLDQYRRLFNLSKPGHIWLALDDLDLLKKLGAYKIDRNTGEEGFTLAGMLMFGKTDSITDECCAPFFFPDYREIDNTLPNRWIDRICPDGTWEANLFQFYRRVLPKLQEILPIPFQLEHDVRIDETPAHIAVREALINTLVHTDYSINASIVITRSKNKLIFSNPGSMLISKQQYYEGGDSVCRNQALQKMFMMLGSAEKAGSGADKIISGWKESNWNSPVIEEKTRPDKVVLSMPLTSILDEKVIAKLSEMFGNRILRLEHNQLLTLTLALTEGVISNERLRYALNMHKYDITQMLKELCNNNYLTSEGNGRGTVYHLHDVTSSEANVTSSETNVTSSETNVTSSEANVTSSKTNVTGSGVQSVNLKKSRMKKDELINTILKVCENWSSVEEIAKKINRNQQYIKGKIIPKMVELKLIERKFPGIPTHPNQKYKKKE